jgi:hypothetical protein
MATRPLLRGAGAYHVGFGWPHPTHRGPDLLGSHDSTHLADDVDLPSDRSRLTF